MTGLRAEVRYCFRAVAVSSVGEGEASEEVEVETGVAKSASKSLRHIAESNGVSDKLAAARIGVLKNPLDRPYFRCTA